MRQQRDKASPPNASAGDDHRDIPRDAQGNPIFLILPPAMRERYGSQMAQCEAAWRGGEPLAVAEAVVRSQLHPQPIPVWVADAVVELAVKRRTKKQAKRHLEAQKDLARFELVRDLKAANRTWPEAYAEASSMLAGTLAQGDDDTMSRAYKAVKRDLKGRRFARKYFTLKDWRYRNNGKPDPNGPTHAPDPESKFGPVSTQGNA
jgi:hypothetical protein